MFGERRPVHGKSRVVLSAVQPVPPAVDGDGNVNKLQPHVRHKVLTGKNRRRKNIVGDAEARSRYFLLPAADARGPSDEAEDLNPVFAEEAEDFGPDLMSSALRLLRFAALYI